MTMDALLKKDYDALLHCLDKEKVERYFYNNVNPLDGETMSLGLIHKLVNDDFVNDLSAPEQSYFFLLLNMSIKIPILTQIAEKYDLE